MYSMWIPVGTKYIARVRDMRRFGRALQGVVDRMECWIMLCIMTCSVDVAVAVAVAVAVTVAVTVAVDVAAAVL